MGDRQIRREREKEKEDLRWELLFTRVSFKFFRWHWTHTEEGRVSGEQTPNEPNLVYRDTLRKFPPQEGQSYGAIYRRGYPC